MTNSPERGRGDAERGSTDHGPKKSTGGVGNNDGQIEGFDVAGGPVSAFPAACGLADRSVWNGVGAFLVAIVVHLWYSGVRKKEGRS